MFNEFLGYIEDKNGLEIVTVVCQDCVLQVTLKEFKEWVDMYQKIEDYLKRNLQS